MSELEVLSTNAAALPTQGGAGLPAPAWRDPLNIPAAERLKLIRSLQRACEENPHSADLRTCLAMAHAVNHDAYQSLDALTEALRINPNHFFSQLKLAELWYRLRAIPQAEEECRKALNIASTFDEYQIARAQLQEIRCVANNSWARPTWGTKPLWPSAAMVAFVIAAVGAIKLWL